MYLKDFPYLSFLLCPLFHFSYSYVHLSNFLALIWVYLRWEFVHFGIGATATSTKCLSFYSHKHTSLLLNTLSSFGHFRDEYSIFGQSYGCFEQGSSPKSLLLPFHIAEQLIFYTICSKNAISYFSGWSGGWVAGWIS